MKKIMTLLTAGLAAATVSHAALADGGAKFLGNITTKGEIRSDMGTYWNQITAENGCKWGSIHSLDAQGKSQFAWDNYDKCEGAYNWAKEKPGERFFKFHALVWGSQYPSFLCKAKNSSITVEKTKQYITEWFDAVAAKFPDLEYIDVVNEAIWSGNNYHSGYKLPATGAEGVSTDDAACGGSYIIEALGGDDVVNGKHQYNFITTAFKMARERWPKAVLIYNDYNTLHWQKDEGIELVQTILKNGAPVDAYGQQAHDAGDFPDAESFKNVLTEVYNGVKIPLFITEYDIGEADDNKQKNIIANQIPFLWETEWIAGITIWGYINGSTWRQNTGIMNSDGSDRASMKWLKEYFAANLDKGQNTTGMGGGVPVDPVAQQPFHEVAMTVPGKVEVEDFDISGKGKDPETGASNASYSDKSSENAGKSTYRSNDAPSVDLYDEGTGVVLGMTQAGEYLEYTLDFAEGDYEVVVNASSGNATSAFQLYIDDKKVGDEVKMEQTGEGDWSNYVDVAVKIGKVSAGKHVFKLEITGDYVNIDYFNFKADGVDAVLARPAMKKVRADYDVFDMQGVFVGRLSAYSIGEAVSIVKNSKTIKANGIFHVRAVKSNVSRTVRITW